MFLWRVAIADNRLKPTTIIRRADDGLVHCRTEQEAEAIKAELQARLEVCGLQMHPTKTQIVYCKDNRRRRTYPNVKFDFLDISSDRGGWRRHRGRSSSVDTPRRSVRQL